MTSLVDYDPHYQRGERLFGAPLPALGRLLATLSVPRQILDLGCGQGRNALFAARAGHIVTGVDLAATGVEQMLGDARAAGLAVTGVVADVLTYRSRRKFDVVLLDRVLPYLPDDDARRFLLGRLGAFTRQGGFTLVTAPARHRALLHAFFAGQAATWTMRRQQAGFVCAERCP